MGERCQHRRVQVIEEWKTGLASHQEDGEIVTRNETDYETTGMFDVECIDCPMKVRASSWAKAPKWARDAIARHMGATTESEEEVGGG